MLIGMSLDEYWNQDPNIVSFYRETHRLWREQRNQELWMQGMYIYDAVSAVISAALGKKDAKYTEKPYDIFPKTQKELEEEANKEREQLVLALNAWKDAFERNKGGTQ